jgi:hypothetical protein
VHSRSRSINDPTEFFSRESPEKIHNAISLVIIVRMRSVEYYFEMIDLCSRFASCHAACQHAAAANEGKGDSILR